MACNSSLTSVFILSAWAFASAKFGKPPKVCGPRRSLKLVIAPETVYGLYRVGNRKHFAPIHITDPSNRHKTLLRYFSPFDHCIALHRASFDQ
jgi:hypothetical protein